MTDSKMTSALVGYQIEFNGELMALGKFVKLGRKMPSVLKTPQLTKSYIQQLVVAFNDFTKHKNDKKYPGIYKSFDLTFNFLKSIPRYTGAEYDKIIEGHHDESLKIEEFVAFEQAEILKKYAEETRPNKTRSKIGGPLL